MKFWLSKMNIPIPYVSKRSIDIIKGIRIMRIIISINPMEILHPQSLKTSMDRTSITTETLKIPGAIKESKSRNSFTGLGDSRGWVDIFLTADFLFIDDHYLYVTIIINAPGICIIELTYPSWHSHVARIEFTWPGLIWLDAAEEPDQDTKITPLRAKNSQTKSDWGSKILIRLHQDRQAVR